MHSDDVLHTASGVPKVSEGVRHPRAELPKGTALGKGVKNACKIGVYTCRRKNEN